MTDIVFLLLIFFLVTSTFVNPNALKLLLPKSTGQVSAKATVSVSIKDWGNDTYTYHINGSEIPVMESQVEDDWWDCFRWKRTLRSQSILTRASPYARWCQ